MIKKIICVIFFAIFSVISTFAQSKLAIESRKKPGKLKALNLSMQYTIKSKDTLFKRGTIVNFNDSSLFLALKSFKDTAILVSRNDDTIKDYSITKNICTHDTINIAFSDIQYLKTDWIKNNGWFEPFAWVPVILALTAIPIPAILIFYGSDEIVGLLKFDAALVIISIPVIILDNIDSHYDLNKKWILRTID